MGETPVSETARPAPTPLEMATAIKERLGLKISSEDVLEHFTPSGEMWPLAERYLGLFAAEVLPSGVANPQKGDLRWCDDRAEVWTGEAWVRG